MNRIPLAAAKRLFAAVAIFFAALSPFIAAELFLRWKHGAPPAETLGEDYACYYEEIYEPFFRKVRCADGTRVYSAQRCLAAAVEFPVRKEKHTARIFILGASTAQPFSNFWAVRLGDFLARALPGRRPEVISCGVPAYDSYREGLLLDEILNYRPDAVVVMSGNNEGETLRGRRAIFLHKLNFYLRKTQLYRRLQGAPPSPAALPPERRLADFEKNLRRMARRARGRRVPILLCSLPVNIRDIPPAAGPEDASDPAYLSGVWEMDAGRLQNASSRFENYVERHPADALGHFWLARCLDGMRRYPEARTHYLQALELDNASRCTPRQNEIIRRVSREEGACFVDLNAAFLSLVKDGLPDKRLFKDTHHWYLEYYPLVSLTLMRAMYDFNRKHPARPILGTPGEWRWAGLDSALAKARAPGLGSQDFLDVPDLNIAWGVVSILINREGASLSETAVAYLQMAHGRSPGEFAAAMSSSAAVQKLIAVDAGKKNLSAKVPGAWGGILLHAGEACRRLGHPREALAYFKEAEALIPGNPQLHLRQALAHLALNEFGLARGSLTKIQARSGLRPEIRYPLSRIQKALSAGGAG